MARVSRLLTALSFVCVASWSQLAAAQTVRGHITGIIVDEAGKPLQDVYVTAHGVEQAQLMMTDEAGAFRLHDLVAGRYVLTVARDGYTTIVHSGLMVRGGKIAQLSMKMNHAADWVKPIAETPDPFALMPAGSLLPVESFVKNTPPARARRTR